MRLDPRRRAERALVSVVQEAYAVGVSTRRVDDLVRALSLDGISKRQVPKVSEELNLVVERLGNRPLTRPFPCVWLDATFRKVRHDGRVIPQAIVIVVGVRMTGEREVLGLDDGCDPPDVGPSEDGAFWLAFLRARVRHGSARAGPRALARGQHSHARQAPPARELHRERPARPPRALARARSRERPRAGRQ